MLNLLEKGIGRQTLIGLPVTKLKTKRKMKKCLFTMVALAGLLFVACHTEQELTPEQSHSTAKALSLSTAMADFTRATDTAFEAGDAFGLYMLLPDAYLEADPLVKKAHFDNLCFEVAEGGALSCDANGDGLIDELDKLFWYADERYTADLVAYYPYDAEKAYSHAIGELMSFHVEADQTSWENYTASDLMLARLQSAPTEETLTLPFRHQLSKVVVTVNNELGEEISDLWFANVYGAVQYNIETLDLMTVSKYQGTIRAFREPTRATETFRLILAPHDNVKPTLMVTTASEKQYTFHLEQAVAFASGKQYTATITLNSESTSTEFTPEITQWVGDEQFVFVPRESKWGVIGTFNNWGSDVMMTEVAEGIFEAEVEFAGAAEFKVRYNKSWGTNRGLKSGSTVQPGNEYAVSQGGNNLSINHTGRCKITYDANREVIAIAAL